MNVDATVNTVITHAIAHYISFICTSFLAPPGNLIFTFFDKSFDPSPIPRNPN